MFPERFCRIFFGYPRMQRRPNARVVSPLVIGLTGALQPCSRRAQVGTFTIGLTDGTAAQVWTGLLRPCRQLSTRGCYVTAAAVPLVRKDALTLHHRAEARFLDIAHAPERIVGRDVDSVVRDDTYPR